MAEAKLRCDRTCSTLSAMSDRPNPVFRTIEEVSLIGTMATYDSQAEASQGIPQQWRAFRLAHPALGSGPKFYGAPPCPGCWARGGPPPGVKRRTHQSLSDLPAYRKPVPPTDRSKSGFPSNHFQEIESALAAPDR